MNSSKVNLLFSGMDIFKKLRTFVGIIGELIILALIIGYHAGEHLAWVAILVSLMPIYALATLIKEIEDFWEKRRLKKRKEKYGF